MPSTQPGNLEHQVFMFTDASYCNRTGAAGWACCIVTPNGERTVSGVLGKRVTRSSDAERMAVMHGIAFAISQDYLDRSKELTLYTDHKGLLGIIDTKGSGPISHKVHQYLRHVMNTHGFSMDIQHVKAHVKRSERMIHHQINAIVDQLAVDRMRESRKAILSATKEHDVQTNRITEPTLAPALVM